MPEAVNTASFDKILVVDDATANLQFLTNLLTEHGYTVYPASDGELALEFIRSILPDLILLDIRMPGMDGYEVCRRIKAEERTRSIPVIFISILEDESDKVKGFQEGAVDYITKPFQPEEVLARIRIHLRLRELTEHLEQTVTARTAELRTANAQLQIELTERKRTEKALQESEERYRLVFENSPIPIWEEDFSGVKAFFDDLKRESVADIETYFIQHPGTVRQCADLIRILDVNRAALTMHTAATKKELLAGLADTFTSESFDMFQHELVCLWNGEAEMIRDAVVKTLAGEPRNVIEYLSVCPGYEETLSKVLVSLVDITKRKQAEKEIRLNLGQQKTVLDLYQKMAAAPVRDIISFIVDKCVILTGSAIGFVGLISDDDQHMETHVWSEKVMENCFLEKPLIFPLSKAGLWAEPVRQRCTIIVNDYQKSNPLKKGFPEGHLELERFMGVPVVEGVRVVAVGCVANKPEEYAELDQYKVSLLLEGMWDIIKRKRVEDDLRTLNEELEHRVKSRTVQLESKNRELESLNKVFVGRELRMAELKKKIKKMESKRGLSVE